jgi:hypothetical protein
MVLKLFFSLSEDGSLFLCTPIDPLFLFLSLIENFSKKKYFCELNEIIAECVPILLPNIVGQLIKIFDSANIALLCETKSLSEDEDTKILFRISEEKVMKWLSAKTEMICDGLRADHSPLVEYMNQSYARVASFNISEKESISNSITDQDYLKSALGFISEYISENLFELLCSSLGVGSDIIKRKEVGKQTPQRSVDIDPDSDEDEKKTKKQPTKPKTRTPKETPAKVLKGMKPLTSFFVTQKK